ncbi:MAG TPA: hypothetical protein VK825_08430 [Xanthobacteraceae bacterium]|jgi:hypothetical protein|nr:hypothetical protein [Xanthobacteraceae bacterium]
MRRIATMIVIALMTTACHAQPLAEQVVALFKKTCADPATPEAMIAAGEKSAVAGKWRLIRSGPAPLPMLHSLGPKVSYAVQWELAFLDMPGSTLSMSIVRPPSEDIRKFDVCVMQPAAEMGADVLAEQIEQQFGLSVTKDVSGRYRDQAEWFFTSEKAAGNCGRTITEFFNQMSDKGTPTTLMFSDIEIARKSPASDELLKCPS